MFVTAGFYDSQVSYAEPAKWVARLRASKTDTHDLLFKTDMTAGHEGHSGRARLDRGKRGDHGLAHRTCPRWAFSVTSVYACLHSPGQ